mgnify:CR=1 FL=1
MEIKKTVSRKSKITQDTKPVEFFTDNPKIEPVGLKKIKPNSEKIKKPSKKGTKESDNNIALGVKTISKKGADLKKLPLKSKSLGKNKSDEKDVLKPSRLTEKKVKVKSTTKKKKQEWVNTGQ